MPRRRTVAAILARRSGRAVLLLVAVQLFACGGPASVTARKAPPPADHLRAFLGSYEHSQQMAEPGIQRVDSEIWNLRGEGDVVHGEYHRKVTFLSTDGEPFQCSQSLHYSLEATYTITGRVKAQQLELRETDVKVSPGPCERGERPLVAYRGTLEDGSLILRWPQGQQQLQRIAPTTLPAASRPRIDGDWTWTNKLDLEDTITRVERERWTLQEHSEGRITGSYERSVVTFDRDGHAIPCAGTHRYEVVDHYEIRGQRRGDRLELHEHDVSADPHPCLDTTRRHNDSGRGSLYDDVVVIDWRGRQRQVLHRAP